MEFFAGGEREEEEEGEGEGAEGGNATHHEVNLFGSKIKVPKEPKIAPPADKKKYTPPPIPDVCDGEHCAGCLTQQECTVAMEHSEHGLGEHCMWNKKKQVCYPKKIKLFGHEIDLTKLHDDEM